MRVLKPEIDEISAKYPKKEDAMKKQQAVMALYKKLVQILWQAVSLCFCKCQFW